MGKSMKFLVACAAVVVLQAAPSSAAPVNPTFDTFGTLAGATFGGSGIPNDAVAITTILLDDDETTITLGLTATQRFSEPPVTNNGAGTFFAVAGGFPGSPDLARWNFNYYIDVASTVGRTFADYIFVLLFDFDPGAGTDESAHGVLDFNAGITALGGMPSAVTRVEDSQNLGFSFLETPSPFISVPATTPFDPTALGQYTFALRAFTAGEDFLGESAILVSTVPEPVSAALFGTGLLAMAVCGIRRRKTKTAE